MKYINIEDNQLINLIANENATPTQAIQEAIEFSIKYKTKQCDLYYKGFTFGIEPDSDINQLVSDYRYYLSVKDTQKRIF